MPLVEGPEGIIEFPDDMSTADIEAAMQKTYPPVSEGKDAINSALQGVRNIGEGLIAAPGEVDKLERSVIDWLKGSGAESPMAQSLGIGDTMKRFGSNYENVTKAIDRFHDTPMPDFKDVQWTEKQLGLRDQYQPQTDAGNVAYWGTNLGVGAGVGGPMISSFGRFAASHLPAAARRIIGAGLTGAGITAGHELYKGATGDKGWSPYR